MGTEPDPVVSAQKAMHGVEFGLKTPGKNECDVAFVFNISNSYCWKATHWTAWLAWGVELIPVQKGQIKSGLGKAIVDTNYPFFKEKEYI